MNVLLANEIARNPGYDVSLLSFYKTAAEPNFEIRPEISVSNVFGEIFSIKRHFFRVARGLRKALREINPDVLVCSMPGLSVFIEPFKKNMKTVYWLHQSFFFGRKFGLDWSGNRIAAKCGDAMVVLTREALAEIRENFNAAARVEQIYNPYMMNPSPHVYDAGSKKIISCGRFTPQKGFDMLVDVAGKVFEKHSDWTWDIYGDGVLMEKIEAKIREKNLSDKVVLKGFLRKLEDEYKNYSFYVMTSRYEGFPLVLMEAMAQGLPCVAFDCKCGPKEIIVDGKNGFLIDCFDIGAMAEKINLLIENNEMRTEFSHCASVVNPDFSKEIFFYKWNRLISELAQAKGGKTSTGV